MANVIKIITDIIEDNQMRSKTQLGEKFPEYYQTKIDVCNQILEKVRRENAEHNLHTSDVSKSDSNANKCEDCGKELDSGTVFCSADCRIHYYH